MKSIAKLMCSIIMGLIFVSAAQAGAHRRIEHTRRRNNFNIERRAHIAHRRTSILNIPRHIMIEINESREKRANNRAAARAHNRVERRRATRRIRRRRCYSCFSR